MERKIWGFPEKEDAKVAYKATKPDGRSTVSLSSRNIKEVVFVPGESYPDDEPEYISPTIRGYHYCRYLTQVLAKRPYKGKRNKKTKSMEEFIYHKIEILGPVKEVKGEGVTSEFRIIKKLNHSEMKNILLQEEKHFNTMLKIGEHKHKRYYQRLLDTCHRVQKEIVENPK